MPKPSFTLSALLVALYPKKKSNIVLRLKEN